MTQQTNCAPKPLTASQRAVAECGTVAVVAASHLTYHYDTHEKAIRDILDEAADAAETLGMFVNAWDSTVERSDGTSVHTFRCAPLSWLGDPGVRQSMGIG